MIDVKMTRSMTNRELAKHLKDHHGLPNLLPVENFQLVPGLETLWRSWHTQKHAAKTAVHDHQHTSEAK